MVSRVFCRCPRSCPSEPVMVFCSSFSLVLRRSLSLSTTVRPYHTSGPTLTMMSTVKMRERMGIRVVVGGGRMGGCLAHSGREIGPSGNYRAGDLREGAGDDRGNGVVHQADASRSAGGDGDNIFQRAAQLDPNTVVAGVNAKAWVAELALH